MKNKAFAKDFAPIDSSCECLTCRRYTRAYIHQIATKEALSCHLLTIHNIAYQLGLMRRARNAILEGRFPEFVRHFMLVSFPKKNYPEWVVEALRSVKVELH